MAKSSNKIWSVTSILETQSLCSKYRFAMPDVLLVLPSRGQHPREGRIVCMDNRERKVSTKRVAEMKVPSAMEERA